MSVNRCPGCMRIKQRTPFCEHCGHDDRTQNAPHQLPIGTVLNNQYMIGKVLGQGGFGITYMGWDRVLEIPIAIKEYYPNTLVTRFSSASPALTLCSDHHKDTFTRNRDRFAKEAKSLAKLGAAGNLHNIVKVHNLVQANNTAYIIMEYVDGIDLRRYIKNQARALTPDETFHLLFPIMESLEQIHAHNIIHRDISPDNIMVMPNGSTKLIDFGAAHEVQQDPDGIPRSTDAILKHGFAPPEQYYRHGSLGPWTDVYAMCATIYYCLTTHMPPPAPDRLIKSSDFHWDHCPGLDAATTRTLQNGTALNEKERIQNMGQLRLSLPSAVASGTTVIADSETIVETKERLLLKKILPVLAIAVILLVGYHLWDKNTSESAEPTAVPYVKPASTEATTQVAATTPMVTTLPPPAPTEPPGQEVSLPAGVSVSNLPLQDSQRNDSYGTDIQLGTWMDTMGGLHPDSLRFWVARRPGYSKYELVDYSLNGMYSEISGYICAETGCDINASMTVTIWVDGDLYYTSELITRGSYVPFQVAFPTPRYGGKTLTIQCLTESAADGYCIVEAWLR